MKKLICFLLTFSLVLSLSVPAFAQEISSVDITPESSIEDFESAFPSGFSYSTAYVDALGNEGDIKFDIIDGKTFVEVYLNGTLTQRVCSSPAENVILWTEYADQTYPAQTETQSIQSCRYSDVVADVMYNTDLGEEVVDPCFSTFDPEGWAYLMTRPSNPTIAGSKPCTVYYHNYDEEPDQNRYWGKQVEFNAGTAIGIVVSVLTGFLTGGVTIEAIVAGLGSAIIADALAQYVTGQVCFSTQKIRYAPVIEEKLIFTDAYVTKRWVVISDTVHQTETVELDNPEYDYNRGHDAYAIAVNAQQAEVDSRT
ncbi:MAG: hypothetical protein Q4F81_02620 [Eubacteriales bacterium]|nr:hypothetical protein [Eubacteriales bacterium]